METCAINLLDKKSRVTTRKPEADLKVISSERKMVNNFFQC
jgi:hypothetical protein